MEALLLQDGAYVNERYEMLQDKRREGSKRGDDESGDGNCDAGREIPDQERQEVERWRIVERAKALDAKGPTSQLEKKFSVLQEILEKLYAPDGDVGDITSPSNGSLKRLEMGDSNSPVLIKELPLPTQVVLKMFFRTCQSLRDPTKLAGNSRLSVQIASKLPSILTSMPSCVLSPGMADESTVELDNGGVWSVFYQLFRLFEALLGVSDEEVEDRNSVKSVPSCLSSRDRATVIVAFVALSLKWGRLGHLLKGVKLLLENEEILREERFEPLMPLFRELAAAAIEKPQVAFGEEEQLCGYLMSFGKGDHGKLGHGQCVHVSCQEGNCTENKAVPTMIAATRDILFSKIDSLSTHSIAITAKGEAMAWGNGDKYRLGHGSSAKEYMPRTIEFLSLKGRVHDLACGLGHTLALMESGEIFAWGNGSNGRLGLGDTNDRSSPTKVVIPASAEKQGTGKNEEENGVNAPSNSPVRFKHVYCGASHSLGLAWDGRAYAWGKNNQGQCGHGHTNDQLTIQEVESFRDGEEGMEEEFVVFAAGGWEHTLFCTGSGRVYSCGCGYKDSRRAGIPPVLGHGDCDRRLKPTLVQTLEDTREEIIKVACGWDHSLAVSSTGKVYTWGSGTNGKLGHGDEESFDIPTLVRNMGGKPVKDAKAGCEHTVFLTRDNELWTCGQGDSGRLGHGDNQTRKRPTKIELFAECGLKPVALAVGDKYNLILVVDAESQYDGDRGGDPTHKSKQWATNSSSGHIENHGPVNAHLSRHRAVQAKKYQQTHRMQFGAHWVLSVAAGSQSEGNPATNNVSSSKDDFVPDSSSAVALFIAGHLDRLASDYIVEEGDKATEKHQEPSAPEARTEAQLTLLPFAVDTSCESFDALLQLLRWITSSGCESDKSARSEKQGTDASNCLKNQERMGLAISCLRILQLNLTKFLESSSVMTQNMGRTSNVLTKRSSLLSHIHELLDSLSGRNGDKIVGGLYNRARRSVDKLDLQAVAGAISREAAYALKMGFGLFYPSGSARFDLLCEVLSDHKIDVPSMRTVILSDQLCKDSIMTEILKASGLMNSTSEVPTKTQNESSAGKANFDIKSLMVALLKRSSTEAIKNLDNEAFADFEKEPDCFLRLLHVMQTHYFSIVYQSAFRQHCSKEKNNPASATVVTFLQVRESLLQYVDALMSEALVVLKRLHKGSRQHEEIITWRLNGSFFHSLLPNALECLSLMLLSQEGTTDNLQFVERVLPNLVTMLKMLDEVSWKMQSAGDEGNQTNNDSMPGVLHHSASLSQERNWFVDLGDACAVLCGKLCCELFYSTEASSSADDSAQYGAYYSLVLSEGRIYQVGQDIPSKTSEVSSNTVPKILEWEHLGVFEVEDELVGCNEAPLSTKATGSTSANRAESGCFLLQLSETDLSDRSISFWGWVASMLSQMIDITVDMQRLLGSIMSVSSWHLGLTEELRDVYKYYEVDRQREHPTDISCASTMGKLWEMFTILLDVANNLRSTGTIDVDIVVQQTRLLLSLRSNPAMVPHELRCGIDLTDKCFCHPRTQSISNLIAFLTKPVDTDHIRRLLLSKDRDAVLRRTGISILHDLLRKLTTSSVKSCLLEEFITVACTTNRMKSVLVGSTRTINLVYEQDNTIAKPLENLFVRFSRIIASDDASFELKKKALLAWTIPLGFKRENIHSIVALVAKSGIMSNLVDLLLDEANVLETHSDINSRLSENHVGGEKWPSRIAVMDSKLPTKLSPITELLFDQTPTQMISFLAWEAFYAVSTLLGKSEQFTQHRSNLFLQSNGSCLHEKELLTPRSTSMSPRRRLTLPKKMVVSTVDESIEQMMDGLFLMLKGVKTRIDTLDASAEEYSSLMRCFPVNCKSAEVRVQQQQNSQVFLCGQPVQFSQTNAHDIRISRSKRVISVCDSDSGLILSFWLYVEHTGTLESKPLPEGKDATSTNLRPNESFVQLIGFSGNQDTTKINEPTDTYKGPELIVFTRDPHPDHVSIGISLKYQEDSKESWYTILVDDHLARGKWIQIVLVFNQGSPDLVQAFVGGKRATINMKQRASGCSDIVFSQLHEKWGSWHLLSAGGNVDKRFLNIHEDKPTNSIPDFQQLSALPKRANHNNFSAIMDDVILTRGTLTEEDVLRMQNSGNMLFRLKQQHIGECHCSKILSLLCQLVGEGCPKSSESSLNKLPFTNRWIALFTSMVLSTCHDQDLDQVYLCHLLQDVLPRTHLTELKVQDLGQILFRFRPGLGSKVGYMFNVFNNESNIPSTSTLRRQSEVLYKSMKQHGILHNNYGREHVSENLSMCGGTTIDALPLQTKPSVRLAAGVHLLQKLCTADVWRNRLEQFVGHTIGELQSFVSLTEQSNTQELAHVRTVINTMAGYSEEVLNGQRASFQDTDRFISKFQGCLPFDSVLHFDDSSIEYVTKVQSLVFGVLKDEIRQTISLPARNEILTRCHNDVVAVKEIDLRTVSVLHLRTQVLRILVATLLREDASATTSKRWIRYLLEDSAVCNDLLQVAASCVKECVTANLGPDSKVAMRLRRLRVFNREVLGGSKHRRHMLTTISLGELESLQWRVWEELSSFLPSVSQIPWWQQNAVAKGKLALEVVGGEVELCDLKVKALEHFPTVRLAQANICANSGLWFFEVVVLTDGLMQIGYVDGDFIADPLQGQGVGDHTNSWAFDGFRCKKWNVSSYDYGEQWKVDDIVGVLLDTDRMEISYLLNGKFLGVAFSGIPITSNSRMCPAASLNVHQSASFNFGATSTSSAGEEGLQLLSVAGFKHLPTLDTEDHTRFRPVIMVLQPRQGTKLDEALDLEGVEKTEIKLDDATNDLSSSSDDESDTDDGEVVMENSVNLSGFQRTLEVGSRDGHESRAAHQSGENGQHRRDLIEGLTGLGFPLEWATRCATETRLPMDETGAVAWILEQMEKVGLDGATSLSANSTFNDDGLENQGQPNTLLSAQLPNVVDNHFADDLAAEASSLAVPNLAEGKNQIQCTSTSDLQTNQIPDIPVFQRSGTLEKRGTVPDSWINAYTKADKENQQDNEDVFQHFYHQRQIDLLTSLQLSDENQPMPTSKTDKGALDRKRNVDDLIPLGAAVDTTVSVAYARQAFTTLLLQASRHNEQSSTYAMVRGLILNEDSSSNLYRFLRIAIGLDTMDRAFEFKSYYDHFSSERSLPIQKAMLALLQHEAQHASEQNYTAGTRFERCPLLKSLCQEISSQCDRGANSGKGKQGNKSVADSVSINSAAAWFAWVSGLVLAFVESRLGNELCSPNAIFETVLSTIDVPLFHNTSFVDKLVAIASSPGSSTSSWKYVSFRLLCRVLSVVRMCERESSSLSLDASPDHLSSSDLSTAVQLPKLIELFTLRHRREMYDKVFFSDITSTVFALLVRSTFAFDRQNTLKATPKSYINLQVNNYSSTHVSISSEQASGVIVPVSLIEGSPDGSTFGDVDTDIVFLKVKRCGPSQSCEFPHTCDIISSKALPSKGAFTIRNLLPDTQYLLQLGPRENSATSTNIDTDFKGMEVIVQTPREPVFELDEDTMGKNLVVLNRNLSAKNTVNKKWHSVRASVAFEEGVHQWQVRLDTCVSKNIFIGVCTADASMENYIGSDAYGYGFLANKAVWHNKAKLHSYGEIFKQGDVIEVTLDCNAKTLAFSRNGEYLGIAASNLRAGSNRPSVDGNTSTDGSCKWYPAFSMYNKDDKLTLVPSSSAAVFSSQQGRPQNASTYELIDNMHDILAYQRQLGNADSYANHTCSRLFKKAFETFEAWRREEKEFREISLGQVIVVDKSKSVTEKYGLEAGDSVFTSKGQCTVVGEYRHELWYEVDDGSRASLFGTTTPQLFSWSLSACREMLSSPDEYPVHRHHKYKLDPDSSVTESKTVDYSTGLDSKVDLEAISFQDFIDAQKSWGRNGIDAAEADAILIAELDTIAASQALSSPLGLSFADVSTALLLERLYDTHGISAERGSSQTIARFGLLLYVNTCLYHVVRLAMPRNTFVTSLGSCLSPDTITNQQNSNKQEATFGNSEYHLVSPVAALLNSPHWALDDPSSFAQISSLAAGLLFSSQKEKLVDEELRRTKTPNRATDSLQERNDADDSSSSLESDLPTIRICFPAFIAVPFWETICAVPKQRRFYLPALVITGESIFAQFSKQLAAQDARQWRRESSQPLEAIPISQSFQVHVEKSPTRSCEVAVKGGEQGNMTRGQQSEDEEEPPLQQPSSKQTTKYLHLFESAVREIQSAHFPLFVPGELSRAYIGLSDHDVRQVLQLDINTEIFTPSSLAKSRVRSSQLLLWYFCFGQLLGIAWRSKILLPLQFISKSFWKELVYPTQALTEGEVDQENRSRVRSTAIRAIRDGLFSIIPSQCVALLSGNNPSLRDHLSDLDVSYVERLEFHATYSIPRQSHHDLFWKIVKDFTSVERRMLEQFINPERSNGTKQVEISTTSLPFVLEIADALADGRDHPDSCYPVVVPISPQLSRLHLPSYSSPHTLRHKLLLAMTNIPFM